jgi:hypothetical protein
MRDVVDAVWLARIWQTVTQLTLDGVRLAPLSSVKPCPAFVNRVKPQDTSAE